MNMCIPWSKLSRPDVEANIVMLSFMSTSFLTDITSPIFRRDDLVMIRIAPWCASGKYFLMSYPCGSLLLSQLGLSTLSKIRIHWVFPLFASHCLITVTIRSVSFSSAVVLKGAEDGYSSHKRLAMPAKLCFNVSSFLPFNQKMAEKMSLFPFRNATASWVLPIPPSPHKVTTFRGDPWSWNVSFSLMSSSFLPTNCSISGTPERLNGIEKLSFTSACTTNIVIARTKTFHRRGFPYLVWFCLGPPNAG